jgi:SAM-dependent methyltransferase
MVARGVRTQHGDMTTTSTAASVAAHDAITPEPIMRIAQGFMASKFLFAAGELGLFEALGEGPVDLDGLAARTGLTRRTARITADAMVALGLLERQGHRYANTPVASAYLSGTGPADLRPLLRFWDRLSYPVWEDLAGALGRGHPDRQIFDIDDIDEELVPVMSAGIEAATAGACRALPGAANLPPGSRVLDVGGGTGSWSIALASADPALSATVLELPAVARVARERIGGSDVAGRVDVHEADLLADDLPRGYDAFLLANVVHYFTPDVNRTVLRRIRAAAEPGARILIADFWTDPTHTEPLPAALMAGEFAVHLDDGDVYSVEEGSAWLAESGWRVTRHTPLSGPISLLVADAC